ncbi:glutathione S-transferase [Povalibacter uvarum]|uniref:Glutathione S-transferase n=1 Tax=Povalibacter uvarum TaxID=732238 RepID=A0A841HPV1_9GAMM|nr:glutathione S-transferase N-terminal domain-containing protein [Povalibacter uvarum]MBB6093945.1 glutathione S-transferase [Povalibacter uvarum]
MRLYYFPGSCSLADHIVLEWIGVPYEAVKIDHDSIRSPRYLALNPAGTVPLLVDGDFMLTQNVAILCYLAERYPAARLFGDGSPRGRAEVMRWLGLLNSDLHPAFKPIFVPHRFLADPARATEIADTARQNVRKYLGILDTQLEKREWITGERSVADPYLLVMLRWATRLHIDLDGFGNLSRFMETQLLDVSVRRAILDEEGRVLESARATA